MRFLNGIVVLLLLFAGSAAAEPTRDRPYRILVTNDDGIEAPGIAALAGALRRLGDVVIVAPKSNQSGKAHATSLFAAGVPGVAPFMRDGSVFGYAVDGTPADCVLVAMYWPPSDRKFDIVVAGINYGANFGAASLYSGTVGAALEASLAAVPAIAFSQDHHRKDFTRSATIAAAIVEHVLHSGLAPYTFLNVNIPDGDLKGVRIAPMGNTNLSMDAVVPTGSAADGTTGLKMTLKRDDSQVIVDTDTAYYLDGYVTVTPLQVDWTSYQDIRVLKQWALQLPAEATAPAGR